MRAARVYRARLGEAGAARRDDEGVDGAAVDEAPHSRLPAGGQHVPGAFHVRLVQTRQAAAGDRHDPGQVEDDVGAGEGPDQGGLGRARRPARSPRRGRRWPRGPMTGAPGRAPGAAPCAARPRTRTLPSSPVAPVTTSIAGLLAAVRPDDTARPDCYNHPMKPAPWPLLKRVLALALVALTLAAVVSGCSVSLRPFSTHASSTSTTIAGPGETRVTTDDQATQDGHHLVDHLDHAPSDHVDHAAPDHHLHGGTRDHRGSEGDSQASSSRAWSASPPSRRPPPR